MLHFKIKFDEQKIFEKYWENSTRISEWEKDY